MLDSVRKRFSRRLLWKCGSKTSIRSPSRVHGNEDMRMLYTPRRKGLLHHSINGRPNTLRSGVSLAPKRIPRGDVVNNHFSWRICRQFNTKSFPFKRKNKIINLKIKVLLEQHSKGFDSFFFDLLWNVELRDIGSITRGRFRCSARLSKCSNARQ